MQSSPDKRKQLHSLVAHCSRQPSDWLAGPGGREDGVDDVDGVYKSLYSLERRPSMEQEEDGREEREREGGREGGKEREGGSERHKGGSGGLWGGG